MFGVTLLIAGLPKAQFRTVTMLLLPADWTEFHSPDQPARTSYDSGYEHSFEHALVVMALVERAAEEPRSAAAAPGK